MSTRNPTCFTLIETIIYIAIFSLIMTGALSAAASIAETADRNVTLALLTEEGDFVSDRIRFELQQAQNITVQSRSLSLTTDAGTVRIANTGKSIGVARGNGTLVPLLDDRVSASPLVITQAVSGHSTKNVISFTLSARTGTGVTISQDFTETLYAQN